MTDVNVDEIERWIELAKETLDKGSSGAFTFHVHHASPILSGVERRPHNCSSVHVLLSTTGRTTLRASASGPLSRLAEAANTPMGVPSGRHAAVSASTPSLTLSTLTSSAAAAAPSDREAVVAKLLQVRHGQDARCARTCHLYLVQCIILLSCAVGVCESISSQDYQGKARAGSTLPVRASAPTHPHPFGASTPSTLVQDLSAIERFNTSSTSSTPSLPSFSSSLSFFLAFRVRRPA